MLTVGIRRYTNVDNRGFAFGLFYSVMNIAAFVSGTVCKRLDTYSYTVHSDHSISTVHSVCTDHGVRSDHSACTDHGVRSDHIVRTDHRVRTDHGVCTDHGVLTDHCVSTWVQVTMLH
jgi:hypothetical protein